MTYSIDLSEVKELLADHQLLKEIIVNGQWIYNLDPESDSNLHFRSLHYNSRDCSPGSLFVCKGANFKADYLDDALSRGAWAYMAEDIYPTEGKTAIIVTDIRKAMALIARHFYGCPDQTLHIVGVTATKGKTTTAYFIKDILDQAYPDKVGFISGQDYSLDGQTLRPSDLSTPESMDLYAMLAEALANGLSYMALEVSSQAYKLDRLYDLHLNVGLFLNFTPDHVSPDEHHSMEDYLWCKRQIIHQADRVILSDELPHLDFLYQESLNAAEGVMVYGPASSTDWPVHYQATSNDRFHLQGAGALDGTYDLALGGQFNMANATAALLACQVYGVSQADGQAALAQSRIPGRMEEFQLPNGARVIVDFAHNYASLKAVLDYVKEAYPDQPATVVIGSQSHRSRLRWTGIAQALSEYGDQVYLTADDPGDMAVADISRAIAADITSDISIHMVDDREEAIRQAIEAAQADEVIILAGKGTETRQTVHGQSLPYAGDLNILKEYL